MNVEATLAFASNLVPYNNGYDFPERHVFLQSMGKKSQEELGWCSGDTGRGGLGGRRTERGRENSHGMPLLYFWNFESF